MFVQVLMQCFADFKAILNTLIASIPQISIATFVETVSIILCKVPRALCCPQSSNRNAKTRTVIVIN